MSFFSVSRFFLYLSVFFVAIVSTATLFPFIVGKYMWFRISVDMALIIFLLGLVFDDKAPEYLSHLKRVFKSPLAWAVSAFAFFFVLAGFFGVDPWMSFWSNFERGEGGLQMLHLYAFFILLATLFRSEKHWKTIFWCSIGAAFLMILYGVAAGFNAQGFIGSAFGETGFRFSGSIGNPAYVATYLIFTLFFAAYLLVRAYERSLKSIPLWISFSAIIVALVFFVLAATRGAFLGLLAAVILSLLYLGMSKKEWRKWAAGIALLGIVVYGTLVHFKDSSFVQKLPGSRIFDVSITAQTFQDRTYIWKMAWEGFKERPILGWGPENFLKVFDKDFNTEYYTPARGFGAWFDRAHSFIFDYLAETGLLGFLSFVSMFAAFYLLFFRNRAKSQEGVKPLIVDTLFFMLPIAYLIQALVLFDVLVIYVNLFLFMAFATYYFNERTPLAHEK